MFYLSVSKSNTVAKKKQYAPEFIEYMESIINHENYKGLTIHKNKDGDWTWCSGGKDVRESRIKWAEEKKKELGINDDKFVTLFFKIHPTKIHVCAVCGKSASIEYVYLNDSLIKAIQKKFDMVFEETDEVHEVVEELSLEGFSEPEIKQFFIDRFKLDIPDTLDCDVILTICEYRARTGKSKDLGPGVMSNFPDRFDGYHTYNRCCRQTEDKGRGKDNMAKYGRDRRAYEYWSDGNIVAANRYMNSHVFEDGSADHLGPIPLGFVHESCYLRYKEIGDNSQKNNRLVYEDIQEVIAVEKRTSLPAMTWYSLKIWSKIKDTLREDEDYLSNCRTVLRQNVTNYLFILYHLKQQKNGIEFLKREFLEGMTSQWDYEYIFGKDGQILHKTKVKETQTIRKAKQRMIDASLECLDDFQKSTNRNINPDLTEQEYDMLVELSKKISSGEDCTRAMLNPLIDSIQDRLSERIN